MENPAPKKRKWSCLGLAFLLPFLGMLAVMLIGGYEPFSSQRSMLYSDMYHQYYPFFVAFRRALREGRGLLYTWNVGMGMDYLGLIAYYLASPLNLLCLLVPESMTLACFAMLMPLKLGLAGMFFALFLEKVYGREDLSVVLFGGFYALCAWALGYQWNVMWLDTFALLPLVAWGTVALLRDKRICLYTVSLFFSVFINYYIGLFTCIFVLLMFFCYELCRWRGFKRFFADLVRIGVFSVLAIGMTAVLELPALAALGNTQSSVNNFPEGWQMNIASEATWRGLFDAMRQVAGNMGGGLSPTFKEGLPNVYCGVGSILLAFLFLTSREVKLRDKLCSVLLLVFFMLSFIIRKLDYIWHGFHFTNMMPYRFSFLFSFVLLVMAYRAYMERERLRIWQLAAGGVLTLALLSCGNWRDPTYLAYNLVFFALYAAALAMGLPRRKNAGENPADLPAPGDGSGAEGSEGGPKGVAGPSEGLPGPSEGLPGPLEGVPEGVAEAPGGDAPAVPPVRARRMTREKMSFAALALVMGLELVVILVNFGVCFPYTDVSNYPRGTEDAAAAVRAMKELEKDTLFYRAEAARSQTLNDGALNGYDGISAFTSSANVRVTEFMRALGYSAKNTYNRYCFEESSPVANLFLNLKYMIERDGNVKDNPYFLDVFESGNVTLLRSGAYLPLGFLANEDLARLDFAKGASDPFGFQNDLLTAASGVEGSFCRPISTTNLEITATEGINLSPMPNGRYCTYADDGGDGGTVRFTYTADRAGLVCFHVHLAKRNTYNVYKNGKRIVSGSFVLPQMFSVCQGDVGDKFELRVVIPAGEEGSMTIRAAVVNEDLFYRAYDVLAACPLELTRFDSTRVEGTIDCDRDGLLYTSIPDDGNWLAYVDGEPTEPELVGECMLALPLTEGHHTVAFRYHNAAFSFGAKVSLACAAVFALAVILQNRRRLVSAGGRHRKGRDR